MLSYRWYSVRLVILIEGLNPISETAHCIRGQPYHERLKEMYLLSTPIHA